MKWLNLAIRVILIKSVLLTLPLYQFAIIQAPIGIQNQIELIIRKFLSQGDKVASKQFSLINWK